ncbi:hypothetical protein L1987_44477 [Smallanthus sonchifolius]|uniref:Uncharacterized protein n=1 Tax=Smallanthus sonchifolius TaxID=185202 RepID=A0ACB9GPJ4_9ASTR|nr:hypothetical protein L1987_44477 [Smallanthus sonchifolius]
MFDCTINPVACFDFGFVFITFIFFLSIIHIKYNICLSSFSLICLFSSLYSFVYMMQGLSSLPMELPAVKYGQSGVTGSITLDRSKSYVCFKLEPFLAQLFLSG